MVLGLAELHYLKTSEKDMNRCAMCITYCALLFLIFYFLYICLHFYSFSLLKFSSCSFILSLKVMVSMCSLFPFSHLL